MSIFDDMRDLYEKYGMFDEPMDRTKFEFRMKLLAEEVSELGSAVIEKNSEEVVDALIDIIVIASGTLELVGVDGSKAWREVLKANLQKERGVKSTRPESGGFDLVKPEGWKAPDHTYNHGVLDDVL